MLLSLYVRLALNLPNWAQTPGWYRPLTRLVGRFIHDHQAIGTFLVIGAEELGIPLPAPGDAVIAVTGYLTTTGTIAFGAAFLAVVAGATVGSLGLVTLGRTYGHGFILRYGRFVGMNQDRLAQVERVFRRYGPWAVIVGRHVPGQRRERGQAAERQDAQGQPVAEAGAGASGVGGQPHQGDVPGGLLPPAGGAAGAEARLGGAGPHAVGDHVPAAAQGRGLRRPGGGLLRPA